MLRLKHTDLHYLLFMGILTQIRGLVQDCPIQWELYESVSKEKALIKCLLERYKNYTTIGRPVTNTSDIITVEFGLSLIQIMNVDEKNQVLETNVWYTYQWRDAFLAWDPNNYDGLQKIMVPQESIWIPDILLYNFADSRLQEQRTALVNVFADGTVIWMPQAILRSTCAFDTKYFPFDETQCHLKFGSWTHDSSKLDLRFYVGVERFQLEDFMPGNEWALTKTDGKRNVIYYECCPDTPFIDLKFFVTLRRQPAFYNFILILPCALLSCLTHVIFWLPTESSDKVGLGMNIFVAFFVLLLLLSESTPKAVGSIPLIGAYFCLSMVMITLSTVLATVVSNMFYRGVRINRAPRWLRSIMINGIATVLCLKSDLLEPDNTEKPNRRMCKVTERNRNKNISGDVSTCSMDLSQYGDGRMEQNSVHSNNMHNICVNNSPLADDIRAIREIIEAFNDDKVQAEVKNKYLREWQVICCVTDRLFFIFYVLINVIGIVVILYGHVA